MEKMVKKLGKPADIIKLGFDLVGPFMEKIGQWFLFR